jgi:DNA ligase-1
LAPQRRLKSHAEIEERFLAARDRGNEGLILKRAGSLYESGKRGGNWLKVKRPYATLDVAVTAAEQGHGRRASVLSDLTFAVRSGDRFLNVGKAYSGLTDEEIRQLTALFRTATLERYGRVSLLRPEVVLEVAFDGVQKSPRHKSGYALRFPRIVRWRQDKRPDDCDTLERVCELYEASLR